MPAPLMDDRVRLFYEVLQSFRGTTDLRAGLENLRGVALERYRESQLLDWGRHHRQLNPDNERQWFADAWWGIFAGESVREYLQDPARRDEALALFEPFDWAGVEAARREHGGVILAGSHFGPPKAALHCLLDRPWPLWFWTDQRGNPDWVQQKFGARFLDPAVASSRQALLVKTAMHLREGGLLFGTPDASYGSQLIKFTIGGIECSFSPGIPALARRLGLPVFRYMALWEGNRIRIECDRIPSPAPDLDEATWQRQWLEIYASRLDQLIRTSPTNLRYLLLIDPAVALPQLMS